ncbi:MAG: hypothetical protein L6R43_14765 [Planctomycetes bacterium]|nr:hypothetical protein [Planctomycetota bacterium]
MEPRADPSEVCPVCGFESEPFRCKIICPRCRTVVESCSDGGEVPVKREAVEGPEASQPPSARRGGSARIPSSAR